jgi:hypothetical protein
LSVGRCYLTLPDDVVGYIAGHFASADGRLAIELLEQAVLHDGTPAKPRLLRCAVVASEGSLARLKTLVDLLTVDWRDVIMAGEYSWDGTASHKIRDCNMPLAVDP